jgi:hypothetical protein
MESEFRLSTAILPLHLMLPFVFAIPVPIPFDAPVTMTTLFSNLSLILL